MLSLQNAPEEILLHILSMACSFDPSESTPSIDIGWQSPWAMDLRIKKSLVRVCRSWYITFTPELYRTVYIHRIGQLCALAHTLEESVPRTSDTGTIPSTRPKTLVQNIAKYVQHLYGCFQCFPTWTDVYRTSLIRILVNCQKLQSISWNPRWEMRGLSPQLTLPLIIQQLFYPDTEMKAPELLSRISVLFDLHCEDTDVIGGIPVLLPCVKDLHCEAPNGASLAGLHTISAVWLLPKLVNFSVRVSEYLNPNGEEIESLLLALQTFGKTLEHFTITSPFPFNTRTVVPSEGLGVNDILDCCPSLRSLHFVATGLRKFDAKRDGKGEVLPYSKLEHITIVIYGTTGGASGGFMKNEAVVESILKAFADKKALPNLRAVAIRDVYSTALEKLFSLSDRVSFKFFQRWKRTYSVKNIVIVGGDGNEIMTEKREKMGCWTSGIKLDSDGDDQDEGGQGAETHDHGAVSDSEEVDGDNESDDNYSLGSDDSDEYDFDSDWEAEGEAQGRDLEPGTSNDAQGQDTQISMKEALEIFEGSLSVRFMPIKSLRSYAQCSFRTETTNGRTNSIQSRHPNSRSKTMGGSLLEIMKEVGVTDALHA